MIAFPPTQTSPPKRKSPQSVITELRIKGINTFEQSFALVDDKEKVYELTECQFVNIGWNTEPKYCNIHN